MNSSRTLTAYLALAALLFGNVAGWVHVGCSGHSGACDSAACHSGSAHCHSGSAQQAALAQSAALRHRSGTCSGGCSPKLDVCSAVPTQHHQQACCGHDHDACLADTLVNLGSEIEFHADRPELDPSESLPPSNEHNSDEHDSDRCSICQNFFESRHAVVLASEVTCVQRLATGRDVVLADDVFAPNPLLRSHTVRGPPSV